MAKYIPLDALVAEIEKLMYAANLEADIASADECFDKKVADAKYQLCKRFLSFIDTIEVKEVDLEKELSEVWKDWANEYDISFVSYKKIAKHFFELGMRVNNPITATDRCTAEYIIINLKRIESDYRIDLTKEMEWLRNQVKK